MKSLIILVMIVIGLLVGITVENRFDITALVI